MTSVSNLTVGDDMTTLFTGGTSISLFMIINWLPIFLTAIKE